MNKSLPDERMSRRDFLLRAAKAGVSIAVASSLAYLLYDKEGPVASGGGLELVTLPDFSVPGIGPMMSIVRGGGTCRDGSPCAGCSGWDREIYK